MSSKQWVILIVVQLCTNIIHLETYLEFESLFFIKVDDLYPYGELILENESLWWLQIDLV